MRTLIFTNSYKPTVSGVVTSISLFRRGLLESGREVHLIAPDYKNYKDVEPYIYRFPALDLNDSVNISLIMPIMALMAPTVQGLKPDLIHSQHPMLMGGVAADFADDLEIPLIFTFHTRYDEYAQRYVPLAPGLASSVMEEVIRRYLIRCSHIIAPTKSVQELIYRDYKLDVPVTVVPTPVDLANYDKLDPERIKHAYGVTDAEILLFIGRLAEEKSVPMLLEAFAKIAADRSKARLLIVGDGPKEKSLKNMCRKLGIERKVIFVGSIPHDEIPHIAAAADLFVFPSVTETQGLVLIEAMAAGTPVVAATAPGSSDVLSLGGGELIPPEAAKMAESVLALLKDPKRLEILRKEAIEVAGQYSIPAATARLVEAYEETVTTGPRTAAARKQDERGVLGTVRAALTPNPQSEKRAKDLSDDFLEMVRKLAPGNLAVELLRRLLDNEIEDLEVNYLAQARAFDLQLDNILEKYSARTLDAGQTISELITLARNIRGMDLRVAEMDLDPQELAIYDALCADLSITQVLDQPTLYRIVREVQDAVDESTTVKRAVSSHQQKNLGRRIERLLAKYKFPPALRERTILTLLEQAERFS
jgi:glycosyltransferase involved in cell wall biosynthesis